MNSGGGWRVGIVLAAIAASAAAGDDEEAPKGPLTRVVTVVRAEDEKPVAGATVEAVGLPGGTLTKTTGADGVAKFPDMPRRGVTFVARFADRFPAWHEPGGFSWARPPDDDDPDGDGVTSMTFGLAKGTEFSGRVVAKDDGSPVAGATVSARQVAEATDQFELYVAPTWTAVTDAEGRFRTGSHFPADFPDRVIYMEITARASGWISEHLDVWPGREKDATFRLLRAARLRGVVTGTDGKPAAGVLVYAYPSGSGLFDDAPVGDRRAGKDDHPRILEARTDAQGRYAMDELHPGVKFFVYAERSERTDSTFDLVELKERSAVTADVGTTGAGEDAVADLKLRALASLVVRVAPETGATEKNLVIGLDAPPGSYPSIDSTGIDRGREFVHLDPGRYALHVRSPGWAPLDRTVELAAGQHEELNLRLDRGIAIEGVVVDNLGAPAADVNVYGHPTTPQGAVRTYRNDVFAKSDASGAFRLAGLQPGLIDVSAADPRYVFETDLRVTAPMSGLRVVVVRVPFISLRVDAPAGVTLPATIRATVRTIAGHYAGMRDPMYVPAADLPAKLDRLRPGPVDVTVDIGSFAPATIHVELKPGETAPVGPFAFEPGVTLSGRVVDGSGRAVAGARVTPYENDARTATTAANGSFALPHLAPGATEICVVADGFPETRLVATAAEGGYAAVIVLRPGGVVRGIVKSRDGERVRRTRLCIYEASAPDGYGPHWHGSIDEDPHFSLRLPAGKYRWVPSRYEFDKGAVVFEVTEGGTTDVTFELP